MNLEDRLAALEADLLAIKQRLGLPTQAEPPVITPSSPDSAILSNRIEGSSSGTLRAFRPPSAQQAIPPLETPPPPPVNLRPSSEIALGGYWVTRIGAILVLLAAVFLAAYLSIHSTPQIRISELIAASAAALGIAYWQQARGNLRFALVLHSLGDALVFFTAFAAYAFVPMQVISTVTAAIVIQSLAGVAVCAHALHRRSEGSALFSLILLTWVAGFSLNYQDSETTLGFVVAIAIIGAVLRLRYRWNVPLAFSAVAGPVLTFWLAAAFPSLRVPLQLTLALLPLIATGPLVVSRVPLTKPDRAVCFLTFAASLIVAALFSFGLSAHNYADDWQPLIEAGSLWTVAGFFAARRDEPEAIRAGLKAQAGFLGAVSAAFYLFNRAETPLWTGLAILGVGIVSHLLISARWKRRPGASALKSEKGWVSGFAYTAFCGLSQIWTMQLAANRVPFGSTLYWFEIAAIALSAVLLQLALEDASPTPAFVTIGTLALWTLANFVGMLASPGLALLTMLAIGLLAVAISSKFETVRVWALLALVMSHLVVFCPGASTAESWLISLALLTAADAAVLIFTAALRFPRIHPVPLMIALGMLGTLFFGFERAELNWSATFVWVPLAGGTFLLGFLQPNPSYRVAALIAFAPCLIRLFATDLNSAFTRIVASFLLGIILLGVGYLYTRLSRTHRTEEV